MKKKKDEKEELRDLKRLEDSTELMSMKPDGMTDCPSELKRVPKVGSVWRRKRDGRIARVVGCVRLGNAQIGVDYRYQSAPKISRGFRKMGPRTNTTMMVLANFMAGFEPVGD